MVEVKEDPSRIEQHQVHQQERALIAIVNKYPGYRTEFKAFVPGEYGLSKVHSIAVRRGRRPWIFGKMVLHVTPGYDVELRVDDPTSLALAKEIAAYQGVSVQMDYGLPPDVRRRVHIYSGIAIASVVALVLLLAFGR